MSISLAKLRRNLGWIRQNVPRRVPLTRPTYCPRLWNEVFVGSDGGVSFCCHGRPYAIGSLHEARLRDLWNGFRARQARRMALTRTLYCYDRCTLLTHEEHGSSPGPDAGPEASYDGLRRIKLNMGELCNIQCVMCDQDHRSRVSLPVELLKARIDFGPFADIELQGGEPLAIRSAKESYLWLTEELGKKVNFLTNGTLMPEGWPERICRGSTWVCFSINGVEAATYERVNVGARLERVKRNVARVLEARARTASVLELVGHFTMVAENVHEADRFPAFARELGLDRVEYGYDLPAVPRWLERNPTEKQRLRASFREQLANPVIPIEPTRLAMLGLLDAHAERR